MEKIVEKIINQANNTMTLTEYACECGFVMLCFENAQLKCPECDGLFMPNGDVTITVHIPDGAELHHA